MGALDRLVALNFRRVGHWEVSDAVLRLVLVPPVSTAQDLLYAFVVGDNLTYIGKTTQGLVRRLQAYRTPAANSERGGSTNINNNRRIVEALASGRTVDIYALDSLPKHQHGGFEVNLAAGLEDTLIRELTPAWNGQRAVLPAGSQRLTKGRPSSGANGPSDSGSAVPSVEELFAFCIGAGSSTWTTAVRRSAFVVEVDGTVLAITPASSRTARREGKETVRAVLDRLRQTGSYRMSDYHDLSFNASYLLALVQACQRAHNL